jgi:23S rRNA (guanosine2251-2'-O)-methyltransferase
MPEMLYGRNPVYECLRAGRRHVFRLVVGEGVRKGGVLSEALTLARQRGVAVQTVDKQQLERLGKGVRHQGVLAEVEEYPYVPMQDVLIYAAERGEPPWLLMLDLLQDPQNLGTLLRTAEVVGVHGLVLQERRSVGVTPAVVSASSGASEHMRIVRVINLARAMKELQERKIWVVGLEAVPGATQVWQADLRGPLALVVGSEGEGMRRLVQETCDLMVDLPMRGRINSLNAAVAGSIVLYEAARQRWSRENTDPEISEQMPIL